MLEYADDEQFTLEEFCRDLFDEPFTSVEDTIVAMTPAVDPPRIGEFVRAVFSPHQPMS